jgi:hypothetical protein
MDLLNSFIVDLFPAAICDTVRSLALSLAAVAVPNA